MRVIIIGAGIIGAALAQALSAKGVEVLVLDAAPSAGTGATAASFGWINASFYLNDDHFRLREQGLAAWRMLSAELNLSPVRWPGAIWYEDQGAELEAMQADLLAKGYDVRRLGRAELAPLVPGLALPPLEALLMRGEGIADPATTTCVLLRAAREQGTRCLFGTKVTGVGAGWVATAQGRINADQVVLAAGTGSEALMEMAGHKLPMLDRPGVLVRTQPIARVSDYILVSPEGEARQDASGAMILPGAVSHQSDETESLTMTPDVAAEEAIARWRANLKDGARLEWSEASVAMRPVPKDGMPVIGAVEDGLYVASMHSGITLAAITAQLAAAELTGEARNDTSLLAPFRPDRFTL